MDGDDDDQKRASIDEDCATNEWVDHEVCNRVFLHVTVTPVSGATLAVQLRPAEQKQIEDLSDDDGRLSCPPQGKDRR